MDRHSSFWKLYIKSMFIMGTLFVVKSSSLPPHSRTTTYDFSTHPNFHLLPSLEECGYVQPVAAAAANNNNNNNMPTGSSGAGDGETLRRRAKRLVSGEPAGAGNYPWMVQILLRDNEDDSQTKRCSGTIINNYTILTAAHCFTKIPPGSSMTHVVLGAYKYKELRFERSYESCLRLPTKNESHLVHGWGNVVSFGCSFVYVAEIDDVIIHEDYMESGFKNDLALVRLRSNIAIFNTTSDDGEGPEGEGFIRPICLPRSSTILNGCLYKKFEVLGWGLTNLHTQPNTRAERLLKSKMTLHPQDYCADVYGALYGEMDDTRLCALGRPEQDTCSGDSGGPLEIALPVPELQGRKQVFQVGLTSSGGYAGDDCGRQGLPAIFTNVVHFMPWILDNLQP